MRSKNVTEANGLRVAEEIFGAVGDTLAIHTHKVPEKNHITVVTKGRFKCLGRQEGRIIQTGDMVAWELGEPHGMEALEDDSHFLNIRVLPAQSAGGAN